RPDSSLSSGTAVSDAGRLDQQRIDPLEATRQLVATPATLALVMLEVFRTQRQGPLAGLQHQGGAFRQHRQIDQVFLAAGDPPAGHPRWSPPPASPAPDCSPVVAPPPSHHWAARAAPCRPCSWPAAPPP